MTYTQSGDYLIPDLTLAPQETPIGKYGRMRKKFLMEHRKATFNHLLMSEKLHPHLVEIDQTADRRMEQMMSELLVKQPAPDKMKHQMEWVGHMNNLRAQAEEVILTELVYA
ncbi:TnpV protein [Bengtsoniella intestinalis]|uniref:TnpV protein n=1 Tax=Bengtsoniella intestinalis TaxID=3073143 RepID=UPI00391FB089